MDINGLIEQATTIVLDFLSNPILADVFLVLFLLIMGTNGIKKGYWFGLWNLLLSITTVLIALGFFLDTVTAIIEPTVASIFTFDTVDLTKTFGMFAIVAGVLLFGWIIFGFIYLIFTPIKGKNYSYRSFDPMVVTKVKLIGFLVGLLEGIFYVLLFNVVMLNLTEYLVIPTEIPGQALLQTLLGALSPDNSILLSALNQALDYRSIFGLTPL
jgi:hypothetical protein